MSIEEKIREAIKNYATGDKKIIIYPFGQLGKKVKDILNNEFRIQESYILDNKISTDDRVHKIEFIDISEMNDYLYLIACQNTKNFTEIMKTLDLKVEDENIVDIFADAHEHLYLEPDFVLFDAQRKGLSLGEWIERRYGIVGRTDVIIDAIWNSVVVEAGGSFCEIGPGTGRYLQKLTEKFRPSRYEFYEVNNILANYIVENSKYEFCTIIAKETDGKSLKETENESQDIVSAYNVWPILRKYSYVYNYLLEMIRVCKTGGYVIFTVYTEEAYTERVLADDNNVLNEWKLIPKAIIEKIFNHRKMALIKKFEIPYTDRIESLYIFQKAD